MILLELFLTFLMIGAVSFGGGFTMIPLIQDIVVEKGWMTAEQLLNFIAVSESTPGPLAINLATFIGSKIGGLLGGIIATIGVVIPAWLVVILVVTVLKKLFKYKPVNAFLVGLRPAIIGIILGTAINLLTNSLFGIETIYDNFKIDYMAIIIFTVIVIFNFIFRKIKKKSPSPIFLILVSACLGMILYSFAPV